MNENAYGESPQGQSFGIAGNSVDPNNDMATSRLHNRFVRDYPTDLMREEYLANVSHEFKKPLSYIRGCASAIKAGNCSADELVEYIDSILQSVEELAHLVESMLEISTLDGSSTPLEQTTFSLDELLRHVVAKHLTDFEEKGLSYAVDLDRIEITGHQAMLGNAWSNIVSNAIKYTPAPGIVRITAKRTGDWAVVSIADTGCGMTQEQAARAFERFYRAPPNAIEIEGHGLGLAIAKAVIEKHGGSVELKTELGEGSAVITRLPITKA